MAGPKAREIYLFFPIFNGRNSEHYYSGIGFLTPGNIHHGRAEQVVKERQTVLDIAYEKNAKRFKGKTPTPAELRPQPSGSTNWCQQIADGRYTKLLLEAAHFIDKFRMETF